MPHGKIHHPARYREITGARRPPGYDPDSALAAALDHAGNKTGLGYRLWAEFIRDFPRVRDDYHGDELEQYDARRRQIYERLKHRDGKYMAAFAGYMNDECEAKMRAYYKRRAHNPNARRPRCENSVLREGAGSCIVYGRGFCCKLSDAPGQPLLASPRVVLRFPIKPYMHTMEIQLAPNVVEAIATAVSVGAITINDTTLSIAYEPRSAIPIQPKGMIGMDINKAEHVTADTDENARRMPNRALGFAQARRKRHARLGVTGGRPKQKRSRIHTKSRHVKHPGRKPKNRRNHIKKRRDERVNRRERNRINARFIHQKNDWLFKLMHGLAARGYALVLEESTINRLLVRSNRNMSKEQRDLLKMGLSQGIVRAVADDVFKKYGLPVYDVIPAGTSSECPACGEKLWAAKYRTKSWNLWKRTKACVSCLYYVDRDDVAAINILGRGVSAYEPAVGPEPDGDDGRRVAGDWEQCVPQLVQTLLDAAVVWFPYTGEGRRPKGDAKNPPYHTVGDARSPDDRPDASNGSTGIGPPGETPGALC